MSRRWIFLWAVLLSTLLVSCGGSTSSPVPSLRSASVSFSVQWPKPTRLIPVSSQSIEVQVISGTTVVARSLIQRPSSTASLTELAPGSVQIRATAYPTLAGTGTAQATASTTTTLSLGSQTTVSLSLDSTVASFRLSPSPITIELGQSVTTTATAFDANGAMVLLHTSIGSQNFAENLTWKSADPSILSVTGVNDSATVKGLKAGSAKLSVSMALDSFGTTLTETVPVTVSSTIFGKLPKAYRIVDIGGLGTNGGSLDQSASIAINSEGDVLGESQSPEGALHLVLYKQGKLLDLGQMNDYGPAYPSGINSSDHISITGYNRATGSAGYVYENGVVTQLLSSKALITGAFGINNSDQFGVQVAATDGNGGGAGIYSAGTLQAVSAGGGLFITNSIIGGINNSGTIVGRYVDGKVFAYVGGTPVVSGTTGQPTAISDSNEIIGYLDGVGGHGFWLKSPSSAAVDLGAFTPYGINVSELIVGKIQAGSNTHAAAMTATSGVVDINSILDTGSKGWVLWTASGVNNSGYLCGTGSNPQGETDGFIAIPEY